MTRAMKQALPETAFAALGATSLAVYLLVRRPPCRVAHIGRPAGAMQRNIDKRNGVAAQTGMHATMETSVIREE